MPRHWMAVVVLALPFLIGFFARLRSLTAPAATAWAAHLGWLHVQDVVAIAGSLWTVS
jgi:uncharacterized membrane protein